MEPRILFTSPCGIGTIFIGMEQSNSDSANTETNRQVPFDTIQKRQALDFKVDRRLFTEILFLDFLPNP